MPNLLEIIQGRRSVRDFEPQEVPEPLLAELMEALRWSPSWANTQCWEVIVVQSPEKKLRLQETLTASNPARKAMVKAPVVLALCGKLGRAGYYKGEAATKLGDWLMFDLGIATQSLCLMAHALGLGTVVVGLFNQDQAGQVLGVPAGYETVALVPLGFPAKTSAAPHRREVADFLHRETF